MEHFEHLIRLLELERLEERRRLAEQKASLPLGEQESLGLVLLDVVSGDWKVGLGGRTLISFTRDDHHRLPSRWGPGAWVTVSPRKAELESPPSGIVVRATSKELELAFDRHPPEFIQEGRLRIDLLSDEVTFERTRNAIRTVEGYDKGALRRRREVLLGKEPPRFDASPKFEPSRVLNPEQKDAVELALSADDFALIHGPPGTGKSHVLAEIAVQSVRRGLKVLCTAASNAAVDHLLELCLDSGLDGLRIGHPARVSPHLSEHVLDVKAENHPDRKAAREMFEEAFDLLGYARKQRERGRSRERFSNAREAQHEARRLMDDARVLERRAIESIVTSAQVICATLASLDSHHLGGRTYDVALFDEATQATEPISLAAWVKSPKVVLAGDPKQLPPTVLSQEASKAGLSVSLFERLVKDFGDAPKRMLKEQHRMSSALMELPSKLMYGGQLRAHPDAAGRTLSQVAKSDAPPFIFLDTAGKGFDEATAPGTQSLLNEGEAGLILGHAKTLLEAGLHPRELAIISPYRAQAALLAERLDNPDVEVDTVDAFQGREKDAVLVSLVRSNAEQQLGFLEDLRRINVAITRARRHLFVVGDSATLSSNDFYAQLVEHAQKTGGYRSAWEWPS
ncbi:MAG: AAA domain-containing protein [Myxococcaceae bacterium]